MSDETFTAILIILCIPPLCIWGMVLAKIGFLIFDR